MMSATAAREPLPGPGACLDDLLVSRFLPKRGMGRIGSVSDLPGRLQRCARTLRVGSEWRAYGDGDQIFFAIARMHEPDASEVPATAIDAYVLDENAAVYAAGVWNFDHRAGWCLEAVMKPSFDCEHGWWLGAVLRPRAPVERDPVERDPVERDPVDPSPAASGRVGIRLVRSAPATRESSNAPAARRRKAR
jgi:hypothetical protein